MNKSELAEIVKSAQAGDNKAIEKIFKEFNQKVYYSVLLTVKNEELAKDITQETFIAVIRKIGELEKPEAFPSWLKKVSHSKCSDYYKKKEVVHETTISSDTEEDFDVFGNVLDDDKDFIPDQALDRDDLKRIILGILNELPDVQRAAIFMRYYEEMSIKEIAEIQGVSEGTVMSRLNYGRKAIAKAVEDYEKENDIKLHALPFLPFFNWIFDISKNQASSGIIGEIAAGITEATGVSVAGASAVGTVAASGGFAATVASIPLVVKIAVPAVVAVVALTPIAVKNSKAAPKTETTTNNNVVQVVEVLDTQEVIEESATKESTTETTTQLFVTQQIIAATKTTTEENKTTTEEVEKTTVKEVDFPEIAGDETTTEAISLPKFTAEETKNNATTRKPENTAVTNLF